MAKLHVRWMIRRDLPEVLKLDAAQHEVAWGEAEYIAALRDRCVIGMVVEKGEEVVGCMVYRLHKKWLEVFRMVGAGQNVMGIKLISKLGSHRRRRVSVYVPLYDVNTIRSLMTENFLPARQEDGNGNLALTYMVPKAAEHGQFEVVEPVAVTDTMKEMSEEIPDYPAEDIAALNDTTEPDFYVPETEIFEDTGDSDGVDPFE